MDIPLRLHGLHLIHMPSRYPFEWVDNNSMFRVAALYCREMILSYMRLFTHQALPPSAQACCTRPGRTGETMET